jgi:hypothetical protein
MSFPENGEAPQQKPNSNAGKGFQYDGNRRRLANQEALLTEACSAQSSP